MVYSKRRCTQMKTYTYGMRLRGFSPGRQPMKGLVLASEDKSGEYYDILSYARKLTDKEVNDYELDYIGERELKI
jgi:hypothetical protein